MLRTLITCRSNSLSIWKYMYLCWLRTVVSTCGDVHVIVVDCSATSAVHLRPNRQDRAQSTEISEVLTKRTTWEYGMLNCTRVWTVNVYTVCLAVAGCVVAVYLTGDRCYLPDRWRTDTLLTGFYGLAVWGCRHHLLTRYTAISLIRTSKWNILLLLFRVNQVISDLFYASN